MKLRIPMSSMILLLPLMAAQGLDTAKIDQAMGRTGKSTGEVYRLDFPRADLHVSIAGFEIKPDWHSARGLHSRVMTTRRWSPVTMTRDEARRLEELCAKIIAEKDDKKFNDAVRELNAICDKKEGRLREQSAS